MDFITALLFLLLYELFSLPLRLAMAGWTAPADVRRTLSRVAGPALLTFPVWIAGHAGGSIAAKALSAPAAWVIWIVALAAGWLIARRIPGPRRTRRALAIDRRWWLVDSLSIALFLLFIALRRQIPEMTTFEINGTGAEKFGNMMIFWSCWFARSLPPQDYWYAGHSLAYYYWGHFHFAWLARIAGFKPEISVNLAQARLSLLVFESTYLLARASSLRRLTSCGAALCTAWGGNAYSALLAWRTWQATSHGAPWTFYNYFDASRVIHNVVDEFPAFSALWGDYHAHQLGLPWLTGWLALIVAGRRWIGHQPGARARTTWLTAFLATAIAACLSNLWYVPVIGFAAVLWLIAALSRSRAAAFRTAGLVAVLGIGLAIGWKLMRGNEALPLPASRGGSWIDRLPIAFVPLSMRSSLGEIFGLWGLNLIPLAAALTAYALRRQRQVTSGRASRDSLQASRRTAFKFGFTLAACLALALSLPIIPKRVNGAAGYMLLWSHAPGGSAWLWIAAAFSAASLASGLRPWLPRRAMWMMLGVCATLAALEIVFLKDRFVGSANARYNSYFKFSYPLWPPFIVVAWLLAVRLWHLVRPKAIAWPLGSVASLALAASAAFPLLAWPAHIYAVKSTRTSPQPPSLSAIDFTAFDARYKIEAPALAAIRELVPPGEIVATAPRGEAYNYAGRVAALAGRPELLGWTNHELQWRGDAAYPALMQRQSEVDSLFSATSPEAVLQTSARLNAHWAFYGIEEQKRYASLSRLIATFTASAIHTYGFPAQQPRVFLFEFPTSPSTIKVP